MSSRTDDQNDVGPDSLDSTIRWALYDSVADAEPSPDVWNRIESRVREEKKTPAPRRRRRSGNPFSRRLWLAWLIGAGSGYPVPGDPRVAWQRRLHAHDIRAPLSMVRLLESRMPSLRIVA
jgi:hypothetical protein